MSESIIEGPLNKEANDQRETQAIDATCEKLKSELNARHFLLKIVLFKDDVEGFHTPPPFYFKISRNFYLWSFLPEIKDFFDYYAQNVSRQDNWFEFKGSPLPFDVPFGVLYDLYFNDVFNPKVRKSLKITFHYRNYPKTIPILKTAENLTDLLLHSIKESIYVRSGKNNLVKNELMKDDKLHLFQSFKDQKFTECQKVLEKFQKNFTEGKMPIKIFLKKSKTLISKNSETNNSLIQFILTNFPNLFEEGTDSFKEKFSRLKVLCAGIEVPLSIDMNLLDSVFIYLDFINYLVIDY
jgi:hypothetical protein